MVMLMHDNPLSLFYCGCAAPAFPLGTVLGVLTILQLIQPEAQRGFADAERPFVKMEDFRNQAGSPAPE